MHSHDKYKNYQKNILNMRLVFVRGLTGCCCFPRFKLSMMADRNKVEKRTSFDTIIKLDF